MELAIESIDTFVALGGTFHTHLAESQRRYRWPDLWIVPPSAIIPESEPIELPDRVERVKPGSELTAVIGEDLYEADESEAWDAIKGFTISNDVSVTGDWPGWSDPDHVHITGNGYKILPTFSPILTEYVPKSTLENYGALDVEVFVDGEECVTGTTDELAFTIPEMVAFASNIVPLSNDDVVALGDPGQASIFLDDANTVTCSVESIGELENPVQRS